MNLSQRIEIWPVDRLRPYDRNARTHSPEQVTKIAASLAEFGFTNPILVDSADGIIAGHGRLMAAQQLGLPEVPVIVLDHLTDAQRRAYVLADNKLAELAGWDVEILADEINWLEADGFDLTVAGFSDEELSAFLGDGVLPEDGAQASPPQRELTPDYKEGQDDAPEPPAAPVSRLGDVWLLGEHRLMCGDSTSMDAVATLMAGVKADMVFTDPPYGVDYDGGHAVKGVRREKLANDATADIYAGVLPLAYEFSQKNAALYLWFSDSKSAAVTAAVTAAGYKIRNTLIWNKNLAQFGAIGAQYKSKHEPCLYCFKASTPPYWNGPNNEVSVWDVSRASKNEFHPTQKPVELAERAFRNSCPPSGVVLDFFGGSGSTLIACEKTGRINRSMELSTAYCDVIVRRWQEFTGRTATLEATGDTFAQVADIRFEPATADA